MGFLLFIVWWFDLMYVSLFSFLYNVIIVIVNLIKIVISFNTCNIKKIKINRMIHTINLKHYPTRNLNPLLHLSSKSFAKKRRKKTLNLLRNTILKLYEVKCIFIDKFLGQNWQPPNIRRMYYQSIRETFRLKCMQNKGCLLF